MSDLLIGVLSALLATNQVSALSNVVQKRTGMAVTLPDKNDPVEREYHKLMEADDEAQADVDKWIKAENNNLEDGVRSVSLQARIKQRLDPVRKGYENFLNRYPNHARARLAFGGFLSDIHEEEEAVVQWEKARELDPKLPAAWNNLANYYGHNGPVQKAFEYYEKSIQLVPDEAVYYENFGTTVFLFRRDATNYFKISEQQVFDKAMALYARAQQLDPTNFVLATDIAQTYYGIKSPRTGDEEADAKARQKLTRDALAAWQKAYALARDNIERQGILMHFARVQIDGGLYDEARKNLNAVTNQMFNATKTNLTKKLIKRESGVPAEKPPEKQLPPPSFQP